MFFFFPEKKQQIWFKFNDLMALKQGTRMASNSSEAW